MTIIHIHNDQTTTTVETELCFYEVTAEWYIVIDGKEYNAYPECDGTADSYLTPFNPLNVTIEHAPTIINGKEIRQAVSWARDNTSHIFTVNNIEVAYDTDLHAYVGTEEESTIQTESYDICLENLESLITKLETLNRKAVKYGFEPVTVTYGKKHIEEQFYSDTREWIKVPMQHITVSYEIIRLGSYNVAAFIDHTMESANIVHTFVPLSLETMETLYKTPDKCDHCRKRTARNSTFILIDDKDNLIQVGKSCLRLYTGLDASHACAIAEYLREVKDTFEEEREPGRNYSFLITENYLHCVFASIAERGFVSKASAEMDNKYPTSLEALDRYDKGIKEEDENKYKTEIEKVLQWVRSIDVLASDEYGTNLKNLCSEVAFPRKKCGFVASLPNAYEKAIEEKRKNETKVKSEHLKGEVEDKVTLDVTVFACTQFQSTYGTNTITSGVTKNGEIVKWFGGYAPNNGEYKIVGTIKSFDFYKGENQTLLTRVKLYVEKPVKVSKVKKDKGNGLAPVTKIQPLQQKYPRV